MMTVVRAITLLLLASPALAAPRIPASDLPGRERYRFEDPPAARLLAPRAPTKVLPDTAQRLDSNCRSRRHGKRLRKRCAPAR